MEKQFAVSQKKSSFFDPEDIDQIVTKEDLRRFINGEYYNLYNLLGAHKKIIKNVEGIYFALWAPNASKVFLQGDFLEKPLEMKFVEGGIFEIFVPKAKEEDRYLYKIVSKEGKKLQKTDPFGFFFDLRPDFHAKVFDVNKYQFRDSKYIEKRNRASLNRPINIYEVHLGSWKKDLTSYRQLAHELAEYVKKMKYTHIELLPITEHPLDESWGYQVIGFFAPTSRFGSPADFQYFVDYLHLNDIGLIMDFVGAHFPMDSYALSNFDGTSLYEYEDPLKGFHPVWNTAMFDYSKPQVTNFLISSVLFFIEKYHIDGIRLDAVSSMLYLDHERKDDQWEKNIEGHNIHLEAISFLRHLNEIVHLKHPSVLMIAEESTSFKGVTHPIEKGGLGFDLKWNMGWMNDSLRYFSKEPKYRSSLFNRICFSHTYSFSEKFLLPYSHDEVVYEKKSLLGKMTTEDPIKELRLLLMYQYCHPGKKLLFMGQELGQKTEWDCKDQISWDLIEKDSSFHDFVKDLNTFYLDQSALWEMDFDERGFEWFFSDEKHSVISFYRKSASNTLLCLFNFGKDPINVPIPENTFLKSLFHSEQNFKDNIIQDKYLYVKPLTAEIFGVTIDSRNS